MRVIAGEFRSRKLRAPPGRDVRPTPDRLREALFNVLARRIEGVVFVDCYAGCGAVGIEALSRGAARAVFIERSWAAQRALRENLVALGLTGRAQVVHGGAATYLGAVQGDIVFLDPPYALAAEYERALSILGSQPPRLTVVQHASRHQLAEAYGALKRFRVLRQGDNSLSFYEPAPG